MMPARAIARPVTYTITMTKRRLTEQQAKRIQAQRSHNEGDATDSGEPGLVIARFSKQALVETSAGERILCHLCGRIWMPPLPGTRCSGRRPPTRVSSMR